MRQALGPGALGRPRGSGWRGRWEGGSGWGTHVNPLLFHFNVWQNPLQIKKKKDGIWGQVRGGVWLGQVHAKPPCPVSAPWPQHPPCVHQPRSSPDSIGFHEASVTQARLIKSVAMNHYLQPRSSPQTSGGGAKRSNPPITWFLGQPAPILKLSRNPARATSLAWTQIWLIGVSYELWKILLSPCHSGNSQGF